MYNLDPQVRTLLEAYNSFGLGGYSQRSVLEARIALESLTSTQSYGAAKMYRVEDTNIEADHLLPIRIYWPVEPELCSGITVFYHGGGFVLGSIDTHDTFVRSLAKHSQSVFVSVGYRLAPECKFPAAVEDAYAAFKWVVDHIMELTGVSDHAVAVCGDSAGGNLAAVVAQMSSSNGPTGLKAQILLYPALDAVNVYQSFSDNGTGYFLSKEDISWFAELYLPTADYVSDLRFSPGISRDVAGLAEALVVVAGFDPLRDQGIAYANRLKSAGVSAELWVYEGMIHGFLSLESMLTVAREALMKIGTFLRVCLSS